MPPVYGGISACSEFFSTFLNEEDEDEEDTGYDIVDGQLETVEEYTDISSLLINKMVKMDYSGYSIF